MASIQAVANLLDVGDDNRNGDRKMERRPLIPRTVDEGFRDFLTRLTPSGGETAAATAHRKSIEQCIRANFGLVRFLRTGSFGNGTSIWDIYATLGGGSALR